jgi:hypothetical protein
MIIKRIAFLLIMASLGTAIGWGVGLYFTSDERIDWEYVGVAPEMPVRFVPTYGGFLVEGSSGRVYANCGVDCWTTDDIESYLQYKVDEDLRCTERNPPNLPGLELVASFCNTWGWADIIYRSIGVSNDGSIYKWEDRENSWSFLWDFLTFLIYPGAGAVIFFLIGLFIVLAVGFNEFLENLRQKRLDR